MIGLCVPFPLVRTAWAQVEQIDFYGERPNVILLDGTGAPAKCWVVRDGASILSACDETGMKLGEAIYKKADTAAPGGEAGPKDKPGGDNVVDGEFKPEDDKK